MGGQIIHLQMPPSRAPLLLLSAVLDREIPGLSELMRARGQAATPLAVLSRAVAGTRGNVLIVNLPGSPKGAVESLNAIVEVVPHVLELLRGKTEHAAARQE